MRVTPSRDRVPIHARASPHVFESRKGNAMRSRARVVTGFRWDCAASRADRSGIERRSATKDAKKCRGVSSDIVTLDAPRHVLRKRING